MIHSFLVIGNDYIATTIGAKLRAKRVVEIKG